MEAKKPRKKPAKVGGGICVDVKQALSDRHAAEEALRQCREQKDALYEAYHGQINLQNRLLAALEEAREMARRFRRALLVQGVPLALGGECPWLTDGDDHD